MKIEIELLVVKNRATGEILEVKPIEGMYTNVAITYPPGTVGIDAILEWGRSIWGDRVFESCAYYLTAVEQGNHFCIEGEAKDVPSLGNVDVSFTAITLDTEDLDL